MIRFLFGSPFTVPRAAGGLALAAVVLHAKTGHSMAWIAAWFAIAAGFGALLLLFAVVRR